MNKIFALIIIQIALVQYTFCQSSISSEKVKLNTILTEFMECIKTKDSTKMYNLFHKGPVTWVGVYKQTTNKELLKKDNTTKNYKISDYKTWFRRVATPSPRREDFHNIKIIEDGSIASITFDYSFWRDDKKQNWGKEFWHLINDNGEWKIASVIFSIELEIYKSEQQNEENIDNASSSLVKKMANELLMVAKIPGLSIAIRKKDKIIFAEGFGYSDIETNIPVTPLTQFRAASTSKVITVTALAKMIQDGIIDINAPIQKYVPFYPSKEYPITSKQLAGNISGMPHYLKNDKNEERYYPTIKEALNVFSHHPLLFRPQTKYSYSSAGFVLLSAVMEGASGVPFLDYVQNTVFNPFSMKSTEPDMNQYKLMPNMTKLYELQNHEYSMIKKTREMSAIWAAGGFVTTPTDLVNMTKAYSNGYLNTNTVKKMFESQTLLSGEKTQVGIGWRRSFDMEGREVIEHAGVTEGTRSVICYFPEEEIAISVMTNTDWVSSIEETAHMFLLPFLKKEKISSVLIGNYLIKAKFNQNGKEEEFKGKLNLNERTGKIILENGTSYSLIHITSNIYSLITNQGIYHFTIEQKKNRIINGKAIRYKSPQLEIPTISIPFFTFISG